jgi:hypothetical protein
MTDIDNANRTFASTLFANTDPTPDTPTVTPPDSPVASTTGQGFIATLFGKE